MHCLIWARQVICLTDFYPSKTGVVFGGQILLGLKIANPLLKAFDKTHVSLGLTVALRNMIDKAHTAELIHKRQDSATSK